MMDVLEQMHPDGSGRVEYEELILQLTMLQQTKPGHADLMAEVLKHARDAQVLACAVTAVQLSEGCYQERKEQGSQDAWFISRTELHQAIVETESSSRESGNSLHVPSSVEPSIVSLLLVEDQPEEMIYEICVGNI